MRHEMRQILFRAKRKDNGEWIEGNVLRTDDGDCCIATSCLVGASDEPLLVAAYKVNSETLCQFTGMMDKNGNRIWENDIISINTYDHMEPSEDFFGKVVYCEAWACWCIQQPDNEKPIPLCECEGSYQTDRFVEGNTFDNPELFEGE